jgi:hypothetical protein
MGLFKAQQTKLFSHYRAVVRFRNKIMGGVPKDPKMIEGWLRTKAGLTDADEELRFAVVATLQELGADVTPEMTMDELIEISANIAEKRNTNGFKRDEEGGLYIESRQIKAGLKETINALFAGGRWGPTKKGPKNFTVEHVFVHPHRIYLGRMEPDGVDLMIGHVTGAGGKRSTITYVENCKEPEITFEFLIDRRAIDEISWETWGDIWNHMEENGFGAARAQGWGTCDLIAFDLVEGTPIDGDPQAKSAA